MTVIKKEKNMSGNNNHEINKKKKLWKRSWFQRLMMLVLLVFLGGVAAGYAVVERQVSPDVVFEACIDYYGTANLTDLWKMAEYTESGLVTKEAFEEWCMQDRTSYMLSYEYTTEKVGDRLVYHVTYMEEESTDEKQVDIVLKKSGRTKYHFFPVYIYSIDELVAKDITISVIEGCDVQLDGKSITEYFAETRDGYDIYKIPRMFKGEYSVTTESVVVNPTDVALTIDTDGFSYVMDADMELGEAQTKQMEEQVRELTMDMYQYILEENPSFNDYIAQTDYVLTEAGKKALEKVYAKVRAQLYYEEDGYDIIINSVHDMQEMDLSLSEFVYPDSAMIHYQLQYDYEGLGGFNEINGDRITAEGRRQIVMNVTYILEEEWRIDNVALSVKEIELEKEEEE